MIIAIHLKYRRKWWLKNNIHVNIFESIIYKWVDQSIKVENIVYNSSFNRLIEIKTFSKKGETTDAIIMNNVG